MTAGSQSHLNAIRDFLLKAFSADELDALFFYAENPKLKAARDAYVSADGKPAKVQKALDYCDRLGNLGNAYAALGQAEEAIEQHTAALAIARAISREIGDRRGEGNTLANLGLRYRDRGDTARAREHLIQALALYEAIKDPNAERVRGWLAGLG